MKLVIAGYGKMGRLIESLSIEAGHEILSIVDPCYAENKSLHGNPAHKNLNELIPYKEKIDAVIEFTHPNAVFDNLVFLAKEKIPAVTGTTGWFDKLPDLKPVVVASGVALFWAPNFSLGMNLFYLLAEYAARVFDPFPEYDAGGHEVHHNKKADSPSGTAKAIAGKVLAKMTRKKTAVYEMPSRPPKADEFHFSSLRVGSVHGTHSIVFDSPADTIELTHSLRNRNGLASGAIKAAEWLHSQKGRSGIFTMDDMLGSMLKI